MDAARNFAEIKCFANRNFPIIINMEDYLGGENNLQEELDDLLLIPY